LEVRVAALDARMGLQDYEEINALSAEILEQYGYGILLTGVARVRAGDALRLQGRFEEAISLYEEVLSAREWRGELTPQVLFWMGSCRKALGQWEEAFAYYQRIYVLYGGYPAWVAKAYIESMNCLEILGEREEELLRTCREMISIPALASFPETEIARGWLERLGGEIIR
jgi:tetratricopeptide (TPR) repeat protein